MSNERRLVALFKTFMERTCVSFLKTQAKLLKQWLYFSTLLSQQYIDYQRLEKYVESLNALQSPKKEFLRPPVPPVTNEQLLTDYDGFMRKKLQIVQKFKQTQQTSNFSLSKTYGGERSPLRVIATTALPEQNQNRSGGKNKKKARGVQFAKRLASLHQQFSETDKKLSDLASYEASSFRQGNLI